MESKASNEEKDEYYSREMRFPVGKYEGLPIELVVDENCERCLWVLKQDFMQKKYPKSLDMIKKCIDETYPDGYQEDMTVIKFGEYSGTPLYDLYEINRDYCLFLVGKDWFEQKYPQQYNTLSNLIIEDETLFTEDVSKFYILLFHDRDYFKLGITKQFLPKRLYGYKGVRSIYRNDNINIDESFYYTTNDESIEDYMKTKLSDYRLGTTEKFRLESLPKLIKYMDDKIDEGVHNYSWNPLNQILPFKNGFSYFEDFNLKTNQFKDFKIEYERFLVSKDLFDEYEPCEE